MAIAKRAKTTTKRSAKPAARKKVRHISLFDRFLRTLPFSESEIQRGFTWMAVSAVVAILFVVAQYMGLPSRAYQEYAQLSAKAGFEVKRVEITGMERVDQLKVYDIVLAQKDRAMPLVDVDDIRADLVKYGWIRDVRVSRRLPDTLVVAITERKPSALWQHDGKYSLIDEQGIVLQDVTKNTAGNLPMINGDHANLQAAALAELIGEAPSLKPQIAGASWIGNRRWDLAFKTGETLALPEGEKAAAQALQNFARMDGIHRLLGRDIIHFDLRDPARAYLRKKTSGDDTTLETGASAKTRAGDGKDV